MENKQLTQQQLDNIKQLGFLIKEFIPAIQEFTIDHVEEIELLSGQHIDDHQSEDDEQYYEVQTTNGKVIDTRLDKEALEDWIFETLESYKMSSEQYDLFLQLGYSVMQFMKATVEYNAETYDNDTETFDGELEHTHFDGVDYQYDIFDKTGEKVKSNISQIEVQQFVLETLPKI